MSRGRADRREVGPSIAAWLLLGLISAGIVLFGAVGSTPLPGDLGRIDLYVYFLVPTALLGAAVVWLTPSARRPGLGWVLAVMAFPAWVGLQLVPLPRALREAISPAGVGLLDRAWAGPLVGCGGEQLLGAAPPGWWPLSLDPVSTLRFALLPVAAAAVFLAIYSAIRSGALGRRSLMTAITCFAGAEALYGLVQWAFDLRLALWRPIEHEVASGTLINRNHFAMLMYVGLACSLAMLSKGSRDSRSFEARTNLRVALFSLLAGLQIAAVVASQSRGGALGVVLVLAAGMTTLMRQRGGYRGVSLALVAVIALPAVVAVAPELGERFSRIGLEWDSATGRGAVYRQAMDFVADYPLVGVGGGTFALVFAGVRSPLIQVRWEHAHNDWLEAWVETGTVGLLLLAGLAGALLVAAFRGRRISRARRRPRLPLPIIAGLIAVWGHALAEFSLQVPALALMTAVLAALAVAWPTVRQEPGPARSRWSAAAGATVLGAAALLLAVPAWSDPSMQPPPRADACAELRVVAAELSGRPLDSWASTRIALVADGLPAAPVAALMNHTRRLDPWNAQKRSRALEVALAHGDGAAALADAVALARTNPRLLITRRDIFERLYGTGASPAELADALTPVIDESKDALRQIVRDAVFREDYELARQLVGPEPKVSAATCLASDAVRLVMQRVYENLDGYEGFLAACLEVPEVRDEKDDRQRITTWLAGEYLRQGRAEEAIGLINRIEDEVTRASYLRSWGRQVKDWRTVRDACWVLIEKREGRGSERHLAWLHWELAVAYAHLEDQPAARRHALEAAERDPARANAVDRITVLQRELM